MKTLIKKLRKMEKEIEAEKGPFRLLALFLDDSFANSWDLAASASWLEEDYGNAYRYLDEKLRKYLTKEERRLFTRVAVVEKNSPFLEAVQDDFEVENGCADVIHQYLGNALIERGYIITSRREEIAA